MDAATERVRRFYDRAPFPGYPPHDTLVALRARAERNHFVRLLDRAIDDDARIADVGCGTGQMCLYLARGNRLVVGLDLTHASLALAGAAAGRFEIDRVRFVESDLRQPGLLEGAFDVVYSAGALHHTPDPRASFAGVARLARRGGTIVVGVYNTFAREAWLRDQYRHPEEHTHTLAEVQRWFGENGVDYLRTYPSAVLDEEPPDLFAPASDNWRVEGWLAQIGWMRTLGREGGLFFTIGRRR
jgi:SAM-dependent methyltransferase